jgi:hypothetical protein
VSCVNEQQTDIVTFDVGGYGSYTISDDRLTSGEAAVGNPGDAAQGTAAAVAGFPVPSLTVTVTFASPISLTDLRFDYYADVGGVSSAVQLDYLLFNGGVAAGSSSPFENGTEDAAWHTTVYASAGAGSGSLPATVDEVRIRVRLSTGGSSYDLRIDNIELVYLGGGGGASTSVLYQVTSLTSSSSWNDISPDTDVAPIAPHDLAIDLVDPDIVHTVGNDAIWYSSDDAGATWSTEESATDKRVPYSLSPAIAFGGVSEVTVSLDGVTHDTKTGNLATLFTVGTIKRLLAL